MNAGCKTNIRRDGDRMGSAAIKNRLHVWFALIFALIPTSACQGKAAIQPGLVRSLNELEPAVSCVDTALDKSAAWQCLAHYGVEANYRLPEEPHTVEDFTRMSLVMWATMGSGGSAHLSKELFASAIDYATCVERAADGLGGLSGNADDAISSGQMRVELACASQDLSPQSFAKRHPSLLSGTKVDVPADEVKAYFLARIFSGAAYRFVIEANHWVTPEMRPCVRYLDGRPPPPSCAGNPPPIAPPPPR